MLASRARGAPVRWRADPCETDKVPLWQLSQAFASGVFFGFAALRSLCGVGS